MDTGVAQSELAAVGEGLLSYPEGFHIHPKVQKLLEQRREMVQGKRALDYGMAEALAFGSLLKEGVPVRLTGQDSRRGTFNQRHAALIDIENEEEYVPLAHIPGSSAWCEIYNSPLSEASVLGFEYGFSRDYPEALVLWEAQFGDFANGAQIIVDQFIAASEDKWNLLSGVVQLLPHGYEGQGPEHSSARIERYLQLAARDNIQICQPSSAAQYFHMLCRQCVAEVAKTSLVVMTLKSMLRNPAASSPLVDLTSGRFRTVICDQGNGSATRVLLCTGKIGHELAAERKKRKDTSTAIVFVEQLYPFPEAELSAEMDRHKNAREFFWVQEEPANMGALAFVLPRLERLARGRAVLSVKRSASASPATGSHKAHERWSRRRCSRRLRGSAGALVPSIETMTSSIRLPARAQNMRRSFPFSVRRSSPRNTSARIAGYSGPQQSQAHLIRLNADTPIEFPHPASPCLKENRTHPSAPHVRN